MSKRLTSPDTSADLALRSLLDRQRLPAFTVTAGAGSGKTTSLVKALAHVTKSRGPALKARTQRVACITYTEVAAREIFVDIGNDPIARVSTIHSFLWSLTKPFQGDIGNWVQTHIKAQVATLEEALSSSRRTTEQAEAKRKADIQRRTEQLASAKLQTRWSYGMGSDYSNGVLGHSDILKMVPELITEHPLLAKLVARRYPFIFVDESQDTLPSVVESLTKVWRAADGQMCLGFFGDPMQQIYPQGIVTVTGEPEWDRIEKPENFRSSRRVLACINAVRAGGDSLQQVSGLDQQIEGEAYCFVLPADDRRSQQLEAVRAWLDRRSTLGPWSTTDEDGGAKVLLLVHRMAARRLGFDGLFSAFNDHKATALAEAFDAGSAWPLLPFRDVIVPLCEAESVVSPTVLRVVTQHSPRLSAAHTGPQVAIALRAIRTSIEGLRTLVASGSQTTLEAVLRYATEHELLELDPRLAAYLRLRGTADDTVIDTATQAVLADMLACSYGELRGYQTYIDQASPYSTQHGSKGSEFERVVVVLDDQEAGWHQYSYDKLLGARELSATDVANQRAGRETTVDRTRRLFYVCVSRARQGLAIVLFTDDVSSTEEVVRRSTIGRHLDVITSTQM